MGVASNVKRYVAEVLGLVDTTELGYLNGATSNIQAQIDAANTAITAALMAAGKRERVRVATTANITIATALNNGDALDGVTLATGNLVLVKNQTAPAENGVYVVGTVPARSTEFNTFDEHPGSLIAVEEGTAGADTIWLCTSNTGGTLDTNDIVFAVFPTSVIAQTITNGVTGSAPSQDAVFDALALKQAALSGTFSLANFTDPGNDTASAAVGGAVGTLIFGQVDYLPGAADQYQTFAVEGGIGQGTYTTVFVTGALGDLGNVGGTVSVPFSFFVPTGRKWKHTATGAAAISGGISAIAL